VGLLDEAARRLGWRNRIRAGIRLTALQFLALDYLLANKRDGVLWCPLEMETRTIRRFAENDWVIENEGVDGRTLYTITRRGERVHQIFAAKGLRRDGMCPACGEKPRYRTPSGILAGYCVTCHREYARRHYRLVGFSSNMRPCPRCGKRDVAVAASGRIYEYCTPCRRARERERYRQDTAKKLARIQAGDPPRCRICGDPVHATSRTVYERCKAHQMEYMREYRQRKKLEHSVQKKGANYGDKYA
jgi:hypothetical protein